MKDILEFRGKWRFLSNFYPCRIEFDGVRYMYVETAYQAAKVPLQERKLFSVCTPGQAKRYSKHFALPADWETMRLRYMVGFIEQKFQPHSRLGNLLLSTEDALLSEGNKWGDQFWGVCDGVGENNLGKILMSRRWQLQIQRKSFEESSPTFV